MNIAFYDGILLQVNLHNGKATILSKQQAGTDSIDFYNYFTKHRPSPEESLLELSNFPANEAIKIISGQPLVNQFFSDYIDTSQENNQATAKEALAYTHNLVQNAFSDIDAALAMHSGVNAEGFEGNQKLYIVNLFGQDGYGRSERQTNYAALATALFSFFRDCAQKNQDAIIRLPYGLGCGLAGGDWDMVLAIINDAAKTTNLNVEIWRLQ
jgi:hypothetical protein